MSHIDALVQSIIRHQEEVMGPLAVEEAKEVTGLNIDSRGKVSIIFENKSDVRKLLGTLAQRYEKMFGRASIEMCKDAIKEAGVKLADDELPDILRS